MLVLATLSFGAGWTGVLVDSNCKEAKASEACPVAKGTENYGIVRDGFGHHYFRLDHEANRRVAAALAAWEKQKGKFPQGNIKVWFTGKPDGNRIALNDFQIRQ